MMAAISSSYCCNFGKKINLILKKEQRFGDTSRGNLQLKGHPKSCLEGLKTSNIIAKSTIASEVRKIDSYESRNLDITHGNLTMGELVHNGLVYQHHFLVKSYESGPDKNMTMFFIINQLQESKLNHLKSCGLVKTGLGTTPEMTKRGLLWVVHKLQVVVDQYPSWNDVVQLRTWSCVHGKNSYRRDWIVRNYKTGQVLIRATCFYVLMNRNTRKLSKFCDEMKVEMNPHFLDSDPIVEEDKIISTKLDVDAKDCNCTSLVTRLSDLDMNYHVNNASYINFILEGTPRWVSENHRLSAVTIKYLKECGVDKQLQSLSMPIENDGVLDGSHLKLHHSVLTDEIELVRATTCWTPKSI